MMSTHDVSSNLWKHEFCMDLDQIIMELKYSSSKSLTSLFASNSEAGWSTSVTVLSPVVTNVKMELFEMNTWSISKVIMYALLKSLTTGRKVIPPVPHWGPSVRACSSVLCHCPAVCFIIIHSEMIKQDSSQGTQIPSANLCQGTLHRILHT